MNKPLSLFARILIVITGLGLIAGFVYAMGAIEKRMAVEKELQHLATNNKNLYFQKQAKMIITEVMSSNSSTIMDGFGLSSDWIEFYNSGEEVINLKGAGLSTNIDDPMKWVFPDFEIGPDEYKIVYASGLNTVDSAGNLHLNFKLNAQLGETLYFTSALGTLISKIEIPPLDNDISYGLNEEGEWLYFNHPTPGAKNGTDGQETSDFKVNVDSPLKITEYMTHNRSVLQDEDGDFVDWVELYNDSDEPFSLAQLYFTDDKTNLRKWAFPDMVIEPRSYLVIYASGKDKVTQNVHTNFSLADYETLVISTQYSEVLVELTLDPLLEDLSRGLQGDQWLYFNHPTPGAKNDTDGQETSDFKVNVDSPLKITEYMTHNRSVLYDEDGDFVDWVELYNDSDEPLSLAQLYFTDDKTNLRKWAFPDMVIEPRAYLVIYASGKDKVTQNVHTNFSLADYETLVISTQYGDVLVELTLDPLLEDLSRGIQVDKWLYFSEPTPGKANTTHGFKEMPTPSSRIWDVSINEVMARNESFLADVSDNYYDWIELKNNTDQDINLKEYSLSKGSAQETKYVFSDYVLPAQGFAVFFANAEFKGDGISNHVPFSISANGETLYLCNVDCTETQIFKTGLLVKNISSGLNENGEIVLFETPTPWRNNSAVYVKGYAAPVEFSLNGGEISSGQLLTLTAEAGAKIYFTEDGSLPTSSNTLYENPIVLDSSRTVRAIAIADGQLPSTVTTQTYIVGVEHDLPIIALSTDPWRLFGSAGIYSNPFWDTERSVHVEFYETDGLALSFDAGIQIDGGYSQAYGQKSLAIHLRDRYGTSEINYPLFAGNDVTSFKHFWLSTSGQDQFMTKIKDSFIHRAIMNVLDVDVMDSRPCVVYINGEYWGLYEIREKVNEDYLASHYGVDPKKVDILVWNGFALAGSNVAYKALTEYVKTHDMQNQEYYEVVASQIDINNYIDYLIVESYFGNTDLGNIKYWRDQNGGKWRWILYDMDWALFRGTYTWNNLEQVFNPNGMGSNQWIDTTLQVNLIKNDNFREEFIKRYALYTRTYFSPDRLLPIFDAMTAEIKSEMPRQFERWPHNWGPWELHVGWVRQAIMEKPEIEKKHLQSFFGLSDDEMQELFPP
jgi:hypothetical protein